MAKELYALILAGGSGARLWPLSREMYPKQLLKLVNKETLFQSTFLRLVDDIDDKNIISITGIKHEPSLQMQLNELKENFCRETDYKIISEPIGKNTAPAIALATKYIKSVCSKKSDPIILVTPSDHLVMQPEKFSKAVQKGVELADAGNIVTFGIKPDKADTGFGYIKTQANKKLAEIVKDARKVTEFKEKPTQEIAEKYVKSGKYYWNSGIFMFKASVFFEEMKKYAQDILDVLDTLELKKTHPSVEYQAFKEMPDISIDYALMEKSKKIALIPLKCGWNDLGSWEAIYDISNKDKNGNYFQGTVIDVESKNSMVYANSKLVTTIGLDDVIVVDTDDALLVCNKNKTQDVKKIYNILKEQNHSSHKIHKTVYRPWGYYTVMQEGEGFLTKCIVVNAGAKLSVQRHNHRSEHWVVLEGEATVLKGEDVHILNTGESIDLAVKEIHALENAGTKPLKILEVQKGDILDENDIERISDIYGRV